MPCLLAIHDLSLLTSNTFHFVDVMSFFACNSFCPLQHHGSYHLTEASACPGGPTSCQSLSAPTLFCPCLLSGIMACSLAVHSAHCSIATYITQRRLPLLLVTLRQSAAAHISIPFRVSVLMLPCQLLLAVHFAYGSIATHLFEWRLPLLLVTCHL